MIPLVLTFIVVLISFFYFPAGFPPDWIDKPDGIQFALSMAEMVVILGLTGPLVFYLNAAGSKTTSSEKHWHTWLPWISIIIYSAIVIVAHFAAWVPVEMAAVLASPCLFLPPLLYRVVHDPRRKTDPPALFTMEETCRVLENAFVSDIIRKFRERYPRANVYLYKTNFPFQVGGLFFHNRERLSLPRSTHLEVTLDCPFTNKPGVLAVGREVFRAYLARHHPEGSIVYNLPSTTWEDWLIGLEVRDWKKRIDKLDTIDLTHPNLNGLPYQFSENNTIWQKITLT